MTSWSRFTVSDLNEKHDISALTEAAPRFPAFLDIHDLIFLHQLRTLEKCMFVPSIISVYWPSVSSILVHLFCWRCRRAPSLFCPAVERKHNDPLLLLPLLTMYMKFLQRNGLMYRSCPQNYAYAGPDWLPAWQIDIFNNYSFCYLLWEKSVDLFLYSYKPLYILSVMIFFFVQELRHVVIINVMSEQMCFPFLQCAPSVLYFSCLWNLTS